MLLNPHRFAKPEPSPIIYLNNFKNGFIDTIDGVEWGPTAGIVIGSSAGWPGDPTLNIANQNLGRSVNIPAGTELTVEVWVLFRSFNMGGYGQGVFNLTSTTGTRVGTSTTWGYAPANTNRLSPVFGGPLGWEIDLPINTPIHIAMTRDLVGRWNYFAAGKKSTIVATEESPLQFNSLVLGPQVFTYQENHPKEYRAVRVSNKVLYTGDYTPPPPP